MAQANDILNKFLLLVIFVNLLVLCSFPIASDSLTIKLIRRDKIDLNLFPKNLSDVEKHRIYADLGHSRVLRLSEQAVSSISPFKQRAENPMNDTIRPILSQKLDSMFVVPFTIGSESYNAHLLFDTGSDFTWLQCTGCRHCFELQGGPFYPRRSTSNHPLPFNSHLCRRKHRVGPACGFRIKYVSATNVEGIVMTDNVHFPTTAGPPLTVPDVVLGCAIAAPKSMFGNNDGPNNVIAGIFGAAKGNFPDSFLTVTENITKSKFSYCLPPWSNRDLETKLVFGDDIQPLPREGAYTIHMTQMSRFYVTLNDISVAGEPLHLNREWFRFQRGGRGGFILDTGAAQTYLVSPAFDRVKEAYVQNLRTHVQPVGRRVTVYELCYSWPLPHIPRLPPLAYIFEHGILEVGFWNVFQKIEHRGRQYACMAMVRVRDERAFNVLGAMNMANHQFVYNLEDGTVSFYRKTCTGTT